MASCESWSLTTRRFIGSSWGTCCAIVANVEVVGIAKSGEEALDLVAELTPDLLTLDVRMPGMDGIEVLRELRRRRSPAKALMLSSLTASGAKVTTDALLEGAFDFILKPSSLDAAANRNNLFEELAEKIEALRLSGTAARSGNLAATSGTDRPLAAKRGGDFELIQASDRFDAVLIGTSTGGPIALREVLPAFPEDFPLPVLVVQHMPPSTPTRWPCGSMRRRRWKWSRRVTA